MVLVEYVYVLVDAGAHEEAMAQMSGPLVSEAEAEDVTRYGLVNDVDAEADMTAVLV